MKKIKKIASSSGFSLTEMSLVLVIISLILGASFSLTFGGTTFAKQKSTEEKMRIIEQAIAGFVSANYRLPCGADLTLSDSNANSGKEFCSGQTYSVTISTLPSVPTTFNNANVNVIIAAVPYQALQLPKEFLVDEWGNKFVYAYTQSMTGTSAGNTYGPPATVTSKISGSNMGLVIVNDASGSARTNQAVYSLMSAGPNGNGSYSKGGTTRKAAPTDASELVNYNATTTATFVAKEITPTFDDIVHYKMRWQVLKEAGFVIDDNYCAAANVLIETPETLVTLGSPAFAVNTSTACGYLAGDVSCDSYLNPILYKIRELCLEQ